MVTTADAVGGKAAHARVAADTGHSAYLSTTTETTDVAATKATETAAVRFSLRGEQTRCQQGSRQNGYHFSHHFLHSVLNGARCSKPRDTEASDESKIDAALGVPIKFSFRNTEPPHSTETISGSTLRGIRARSDLLGRVPASAPQCGSDADGQSNERVLGFRRHA
jgi:hypothetical protein